MPLFFDYSRPGPGVNPDEPRKKGFPRIWEMISRDFKSFWPAGAINLLFSLPFVFALRFAYYTHSVLFALLAGLIGGILAAPSFLGLADTLLRSLRDEPGFWWHRYSRALKRSWKGTLLPGAIMGMVFSVQVFTLLHMPVIGGGLALLLCQLVGMILSVGLFAWGLPQQALLELSFPALVKNCFLLFFRHIGKTLTAAAILLGYAILVWLLFPASVFLLLAAGLWLPLLCALQVIYPTLDEIFGVEEAIEKSRKNEK